VACYNILVANELLIYKGGLSHEINEKGSLSPFLVTASVLFVNSAFAAMGEIQSLPSKAPKRTFWG